MRYTISTKKIHSSQNCVKKIHAQRVEQSKNNVHNMDLTNIPSNIFLLQYTGRKKSLGGLLT